MNDLTVNFMESTPADVETRRSEDLVFYEASHGVTVNYKKFALLLRDFSYRENANNTIGVLEGYTAYAEIYIDDLWVDSNHRNLGHGSRLLRELEVKFRDKGFNNINLVTSAFQAAGFYRKCGFVEEFTRVNSYNPRFNKTFFVKFFSNSDQTQGILSGG
jgi:ribosomal protein S18 acetylase RimI-like enzyme